MQRFDKKHFDCPESLFACLQASRKSAPWETEHDTNNVVCHEATVSRTPGTRELGALAFVQGIRLKLHGCLSVNRNNKAKTQTVATSWACMETRWNPRTRMETRSKNYICPNDTLVGHSCGTLFWDTLVGHSYRTLLWVSLVGNSCGTLL